MSQVTRVLAAIEQGDPQAADQLLPLVYDELRELAAQKLAHEKPGHTLQPTALVHEAFLRLVGGEPGRAVWDGRGHFFAAAAEAMRRILVEAARRRGRQKRGGGRRRMDLAHVAVADLPPDDLLDLNAAVDALAAEDPSKAELVRLRFYGGLS